MRSDYDSHVAGDLDPPISEGASANSVEAFRAPLSAYDYLLCTGRRSEATLRGIAAGGWCWLLVGFRPGNALRTIS